MTGTSIALRRGYLSPQRRLIIARAIAGSLAGLVPLPFVDDWVKAAVLGGGYRRIAAAHGVDLDDRAVANLVHGKTTPPSLTEMAASGIAYRVAGVAAKRVLVALGTVNRARATARTFVTMTLFDHYCAKLHTGGALDGPTALALREEISRAIEQTPGALSFHPFRRGAIAAAKATVKAPFELANLVTGGLVRRMLAKRAGGDVVTEPEAVDQIEQTLTNALADEGGFLARTVASVEQHLSGDANPYLDGALDALDRRWKARVAAGVE